MASSVLSALKFTEWTLRNCPYSDGNTNYKCWVKSFGRGKVFVGEGESLLICYSYGANSEYSMSSTRWNYDAPPLTPEEAMREVDMQQGKHSNKIQHPKRVTDRERIKKFMETKGE